MEKRYTVVVDGEEFEIEFGPQGRVWVNHRPYWIDFRGLDGEPGYSLLLDNRSYEAFVETLTAKSAGRVSAERRMVVGGRPYHVSLRTTEVQGKRGADISPPTDDTGDVVAPLPGMLIAVPVEEGEMVAKGDVVAVMESMKMNLELRTARDGVVRSIYARPGAELNQGDPVVSVECSGR